jgi:hypothetical protein
MKFKELTNDQIEQILGRIEWKISEARAMQLDALEELDRRQAFTADGCRTMDEWTASRLDVGSDTARKLVRTMRRTVDRRPLRELLAGGASFDRVEALAKLPIATGPYEHLDVNVLRRRVARHVEVSERDESKTMEDRYLVMQPSLDESWWQVRGGLDGVTGAVVDSALAELADRLPDLPDGRRPGAGWRRATALYELASGGNTPEATVTVFVDAETTVGSNGATGMRLEAGPRVGAKALGAILCGSVTEVTVNAADGVPMRYGRSSRMIPGALRRALLAATDGRCAIDGCDSTYRVEIHHRTPWSLGGRTDPENLIPLCWFHHHIAIHERGFELYEHPAHGRVRLRKALAPTVRREGPRRRQTVAAMGVRDPVLVGSGIGTQPEG